MANGRAVLGRPAELRTALADRWIIGFVLLGLGLRCAYALAHHVLPAGDQLDYLATGHDFLGWWNSYRTFRTPGYPAFLGALFGIGLGENGVRVAQAIVLSGACYLAAALGARLAGRLAGRSAALAGAVFPPLVTLPSVILPDALAAALFAAGVFALCEGWGRRRWLGWIAAASTLIAGAALVRPNLALFLPVLAGIALLGTRGARRRAMAVAVVVVPVLVLFSPWVARNYVETGGPSPLGTNDVPFILGVSLPIDMTSGRFGAGQRSVHYDVGGAAPGVRTLDEVESNDPWATLVDNVRERPIEQLEASAFWQRELWLFPFDDHTAYGQSPPIPFELTLAAHAAFLTLALAGLWLGRRAPPSRVIAASVLAVAAPFFIVKSEPRYALPATTVMLVPVGHAAAAAAARIPGARVRRPPPAGEA